MSDSQRIRRATINDVAKAAGVSIKTVSRVMNREPAVRDATRDKVMKAAKALDYSPNLSARSLAGERSYLIGLLYDNPSPYYMADIQRGALERCMRQGYHLILEPCDSQSEGAGEAVRRLIKQANLESIILTPPLSDNRAIVDMLDSLGAPYVRIAPGDTEGGGMVVRMEDRRAACELTQYLIDQGHSRIGFIKGHPDHAASHDRLDGYKDALKANGLAVDDSLIEPGLFSYRSGLEAGERLLGRPDRPTAIFASNDDMAAGVATAAHKLSLKLPGDLSLSGFDDSPIASVIWPRLTTVRQPIAEMAGQAVQLLIDRPRGQTAQTGGAETPIKLVDFELIVRESSGSPTN